MYSKIFPRFTVGRATTLRPQPLRVGMLLSQCVSSEPLSPVWASPVSGGHGRHTWRAVGFNDATPVPRLSGDRRYFGGVCQGTHLSACEHADKSLEPSKFYAEWISSATANLLRY